MILRSVAVVVALALLGATAHAVIEHAGGYGTPHAVTTIALAAGVAIGALAIGAAWHQRRRVLAVILCLALLAGELFGLLSTAERLVAQREALQAPIMETHAARKAAGERLAMAERELAKASESDRVRRAETAKAEADQAALAKAAERSCAANCRALLEQQVTSAEAELKAARAEVAQRIERTTAAAAKAREAVAAIKAPASATPLADRLGVAGWSLDLIVAALGSLAANGLAAALLVFAGHGARKPETPAQRVPMDTAGHSAGAPPPHASMEGIEPPPSRVAAPVINVAEHAARFGVECLAPTKDGFATLEAIKGRYLEWCNGLGVEPLPDARIGKALADLFGAVGLRVEDRGGVLAVVGIAVKSADCNVRALPRHDARRMRVVGEPVEDLCAASPSASNLRASA